MTSALKFSVYFRREFTKIPQSYDIEVAELIKLLSKPSFDREPFIEIANKVLRDYDNLYTKTHPKTKNISLSSSILKDARFPEFAKDVEQVYNAMQYIITDLEKQSINDNPFISSLVALVTHTNNIKTHNDLKISVMADNSMPKKHGWRAKVSWFFKRVFLGVAITSSVGIGNLGRGNADASIPNEQIKSIQFERIKKDEATKILMAEAAKKLEEEKEKKFLTDYNAVQVNRKDVIAKAKSVLSKAKMPTDYLKPGHIIALIYQESRFDPEAVSRVGAYGLMQVMGGSPGMSIEENIKAGLKILKGKEEYCRKNHPNWDKLSDAEKIDMLFAVYNCGEGRMERDYKWNLLQANSETQDHLTYIHDYWKYT